MNWDQDLNNVRRINDEETQRFLERIANTQSPTFDPNVSVNAALQARQRMKELLAPYSSTPLDSSLDSGGIGTANRLTKISNDLGNARSMYTARQNDIERGMQYNQDTFNTGIGKLKMANDMMYNQRGRLNDQYNNEITRQAQLKLMQEEYNRRVEELKKQANEALRKGDMLGWQAALTAIGTIVGAYFGGPAGAAAGGAAGNYAGSKIGGY